MNPDMRDNTDDSLRRETTSHHAVLNFVHAAITVVVVVRHPFVPRDNGRPLFVQNPVLCWRDWILMLVYGGYALPRLNHPTFGHNDKIQKKLHKITFGIGLAAGVNKNLSVLTANHLLIANPDFLP